MLCDPNNSVSEAPVKIRAHHEAEDMKCQMQKEKVIGTYGAEKEKENTEIIKVLSLNLHIMITAE